MKTKAGLTLSSDKKVLISCDREAKKFEIPDSVTTIDDGAFAFCIDLKSVKCPSSLTAIGGQAFAYSGITSFYIGEHVSSIGDGAFANCYDLEKIRVSPKNKYYRSIEGVLFNKANTVLIYYPQGKEDPFYKIPPPVTQLFPAAFLDCRNLKALHINEKLQDIATYNFLDCYDLQRITVDEKNTCFSLRDDVLFDCNQMILLLYPRDKEDRTYTVPEGVQDIHVGSFNYNFFLTSITLPDSVIALGPMCFCKCSALSSIKLPTNIKSIPLYAFNGCTSLTEITVPNGVKKLERRAFSNCKKLSKISLPMSVKFIKYEAFKNCHQLKEVYFEGTSEYFENNVCVGLGNDDLKKATWHYKTTT